MDKIKIPRGFTKGQRTILCDARILSGKLLGEKLGSPPAPRWMENLIAHWKKGVRIFFSCHAVWAPGKMPGLHTDESPTVRCPPYRRPATGRPSDTTVSDA